MNKFFSLLGLCKRAGKLVAGEVAAEQAVRKKQAYLLILAQDASKNTKKKFTNSAVYYELPLAEIGTKEELGRAIGAEMRSIIAITEKGFAKKLKELADERIERRSVKADFRERRGVVECPKSEFMNWQSSLALPIKT